VPDNAQLKVLIQFYDSASDPRIRVKCIGALECLAQYPGSIEGNRVSYSSVSSISFLQRMQPQIIVDYLLAILPTSVNPSSADTESLIQAVSALIDIFSDETLPYDINFRDGRVGEKLVESVDEIKIAVKAIDKRKEGGKDLRRRGEEVLENLQAFIEYRKDLGIL
jgi:hypothetical protein